MQHFEVAVFLWPVIREPNFEHNVPSFFSNKRLHDALTGNDMPSNPPGRLDIDLTNEEQAAHDTAEAAYRTTLDDIEERKNILLSYLAVVLDSSILMLIRHYSVDNEGLRDGRKAFYFSKSFEVTKL